MVVKPSGFSPQAWGSRGVTIGHDVPAPEWGAALEAAMVAFEQNPHVLQPYFASRRFSVQWFDMDQNRLRDSRVRGRFSPYYIDSGEDVQLAGILATACPGLVQDPARHGRRRDGSGGAGPRFAALTAPGAFKTIAGTGDALRGGTPDPRAAPSRPPIVEGPSVTRAVAQWKQEMRNCLRQGRMRLPRTSWKPRKSIRSASSTPSSPTPTHTSLIEEKDDPIWKQVIPSSEELSDPTYYMEDALGEDGEDSPVPHLTHRYPDRVLFTVTYTCAIYCRFCTRKRKVGKYPVPRWSEMEAVFDYLRAHPEIRDVLLSRRRSAAALGSAPGPDPD